MSSATVVVVVASDVVVVASVVVVVTGAVLAVVGGTPPLGDAPAGLAIASTSTTIAIIPAAALVTIAAARVLGVHPHPLAGGEYPDARPPGNHPYRVICSPGRLLSVLCVDVADIDWIPEGTRFGAQEMTYFVGRGERDLDEHLAEVDLVITGPHASAAPSRPSCSPSWTPG